VVRIKASVTSFIENAFKAITTVFVKPNRVALPVMQYFAYGMKNNDLLVDYGLP